MYNLLHYQQIVKGKCFTDFTANFLVFCIFQIIVTNPGKLCNAPNVPVTSEEDCQAAAKELGKFFNGWCIASWSCTFSQKGCIMSEHIMPILGGHPTKIVWWNTKGRNKEEDLKVKRASSICYI